jgi:hypothetical protein
MNKEEAYEKGRKKGSSAALGLPSTENVLEQINGCKSNRDDLWAAYDKGVLDGVRSYVEDKGK